MPQQLARAAALSALCALIALTGLYLWYFADHAGLLLAHPYPLDYGEGPLLAQVERLRAGAPIWQLYADPAAPPYLVVNYPPLYLLLCAGLAPIAGSTLAAGRLLSLIGALASTAALALLARSGRDEAGGRAAAIAAPILAGLLFLSVPVVREWAALMRVDMLGLALGLWGLILVRRAPRGGAIWGLLGGLLLCACLYTKPSLIAAPGAAWLWLALQAARAPRGSRSVPLTGLLGLTTALAGGGLLFAWLQWASAGWFAIHVVAANANRWEADLAWGFWAQQIGLRWPLALAALLAIGAAWRSGRLAQIGLPLLYSALGVLTAIGVGKVGAYSNYFLELYTGLFWLIGLGAAQLIPHLWPGSSRASSAPPALISFALCALLLASLLYYPPLWDENRLRPAGLLEPSRLRLAFGRYGLWADARREADLLAALARVYATLAPEARAAAPTIFTDMPGVAAAAGVTARLPVFEARQLFDQGLADQTPILAELAAGTIPLAVLDYLGNWLTPEMVELLQRRYAHDGSFGTFDMFRPVEVGPAQALDEPFVAPSGELRLVGYRLAEPAGLTYEPGELLALALDWRYTAADAPAGQATPEVIVRLLDAAGAVRAEARRPLLYAAFPPERWPAGATMQHMQPIALPSELPPGDYQLVAGLDEADLRPIAAIAVAPQGGRYFAETGHFVPAPLMRAWAELGVERAGYPLTPLVPFAWGRLQCFERICLEQREDGVGLRDLGERLYLAETIRGEACLDGPQPADGALCPGFAEALERYGSQSLGRALSGELARNGWIVQWTRQARLERQPGSTEIGLGRLGDDSLRLSPGQPYRWP